MATSEQERAIIEAAKALVERLTKDGEWYTNDYGQPTCIVCGSTTGTHDANCELATLMNAVEGKKYTASIWGIPVIDEGVTPEGMVFKATPKDEVTNG